MSRYDQLLPWRRIAATVARLARPELGLQGTLVAIGILLSLFEGIGLTFGLLLIYRILGAHAEHGWDGVVGRLIARLDRESTVRLVALALAGVIVAALLTELNRVIGEVIANRVTHRARSAIYAAYLRTSYQHASSQGHGAMLDTLDYETPFLTAAVLHAGGIAVGLCAVAVYGAYLLFLSPLLGSVILASGLVLAATLNLVGRRLSRLGSRISVLNERLLAHTVATVEGMRTIRLHAAEAGFIDRYAAASGSVADAHVRLAATHSAVAGLRRIGKLAAFALLIWAAVAAAVPVATAIVVIALLFRMIPHAAEVEGRVLTLFNGRLPLSIICHAIDPAQVRPPSSGTRVFRRLEREMRFEDVHFAHDPATPVLKGVSFEIPAGTLMTLIGPSGAGKTTLINLLARLYEPQGGSILVDGIPIGAFDRASWLARLGFSGQDIDLQEGTILDNVRFFDPAISEVDARWALGVAHIDDFVDGLPEGLHTPVGDRGLRLSGGQRQRIGLARAIARRPDLLILDEATNAVDIALEGRIYAAIRAALPDATILVITHRAAIENAAQQIVLDDGRVVTARVATAGARA